MPIVAWVFVAVAGAAAIYFATKSRDAGGDDASFLAGQVAEDVRRKGARYDHGLVARFQRAAHIAPSGLYDAEVVSALMTLGVPNPPPALVRGGQPAYIPGVSPDGSTTAEDIKAGVDAAKEAVPVVESLWKSIFGGGGGGGNGQEEADAAARELERQMVLQQQQDMGGGYNFTQDVLLDMARRNPQQLDYLLSSGQITGEQYNYAVQHA